MPRRTRRTGGGLVSLDGWFVVSEAKPNEDTDKAYDAIEINRMRACRLEAPGANLLFCLEPKQVANRGEVADCAAVLSGNCRACTERIQKFAQLIGEGGNFVAFCQEVSEENVDMIRTNREKQERSSDVSQYNFIVIDREFAARYPQHLGGFQHVHFTFEEFTDPAVSAKIKKLSNYMNGSFENRFQRLVDDPASLKIIQEEIPKLVRPDHWKAVTSWAVNFVSKAGGRTWSQLAMHEKFEIMSYALLTGRCYDAIHTDLQQAGNLVDFMDAAHSRAGLRAMMDDRSNPETYQVSRVAEILRDKAVTSLCTVTLTWGGDGPNKSDLDLHTKVDGQELYYSRKVVGKCKLDFDANAQKVEAFPAENISLNQPGIFTFRVNNYNNRDGTDVPFQVTVKKPGFSQVYTGVWPKARAEGNFMEVCDVTVTPEDLVEKPLELSEAERKQLAAKEAEWARLIGDPTSAVATDADVELVPVKSGEGSFAPASRTTSAQAVFSSMLTSPSAGKAPGKSTLADRCKLETLSGLMKHVMETQCSLQVDPRNFVPAYVTRLKTATDVLFDPLAVNVYHRKNELPQAPRSDEQSTVRFDPSWGLSNRAAVHGFVKMKNFWFMVLQGAHLPTDSSWPRGAGMYPTNLKPEAHHHRSKWVSFHSLVVPEETAGSGVPLIGSALLGFPSFRFILDGKEISVSAD